MMFSNSLDSFVGGQVRVIARYMNFMTGSEEYLVLMDHVGVFRCDLEHKNQLVFQNVELGELDGVRKDMNAFLSANCPRLGASTDICFSNILNTVYEELGIVFNVPFDYAWFYNYLNRRLMSM